MAFFDKKEEVMNIQLTPHGRYLLSIGKLKPHSYRFFDDNVIYNSDNAGFSESQNGAHLRIKEETPLLKQNPNITGVETNIKKFEAVEVYAKRIRMPTLDDVISTNNESIGTNSYTSKHAPFYKVELYKSKFVESAIKTSYTSKNVGSVPIPQLPINFYLSSSIQKGEGEFSEFAPFAYDESASSYIDSQTFADGTYFVVKVEDPLIKINELNAFDETDKLIMSAFKVNRMTDGTITYKRLKFDRTIPLIKNDVLLDEDSIPEEIDFELEQEETEYTPEYINYYLSFIFDKQIPDELICNTIGDLEIRNIYLDEKIDCPDVEDDIDDFDIYTSRVRLGDLDDEACD
jgi:hypothetical protein